jgi:hypothetical protein|nr:MAG TPA: hypothetical protein [Caudoviricetes sp.]
MKINVFNTQCRIGSKVRYKSKIREVYDINRITHELCLSRSAKWIRCTEVELLTHRYETIQQLG